MTRSKITSGKLTYADLESLPNDGKRYEIIAGNLYVNASPNTYHQLISRRIQHQLYTQIELTGRGQVINAPMDVVLSANDIVEPDLIVVLQARSSIITQKNIQGSPDLLVEITSPSTAKVDRREKKELYERSKIPEYWVVDPESQSVDQFLLERDGYHLKSRCKEAIDFVGLPGVRVDLRQVW